MDPDHPAAVAERAAVLAYVERLHDMLARLLHDRPPVIDVLSNLYDAIEAGAHLDTPPDLRCKARTTAPTGEE